MAQWRTSHYWPWAPPRVLTFGCVGCVLDIFFWGGRCNRRFYQSRVDIFVGLNDVSRYLVCVVIGCTIRYHK